MVREGIAFLINKLKNSEMIKVFTYTSMSTVIKILTSFISIKVISNILGPSGIALIGQLNNFSSILMSFASLGINQGITRYVSENRYSSENLRKIIGTAFKLTFGTSVFLGLLLVLASSFFSRAILFKENYTYVFVIFGLLIVFYALNNLILSVLNGLQEYKRYVQINILNSITGLAFTVGLVYVWELKGALISLISYQSMMFFISLIMIRKDFWLKYLRIDGVNFDIGLVKKYFNYTIMTLTSAILIPSTSIVLRRMVTKKISLDYAGYWESMNKMSSMYLMIITMSLSVYFLPKLSQLTKKEEIRSAIKNIYRFIVPFLIIFFAIIYFTRSWIVQILFNEKFVFVEKLFFWQLLGDFFKMISWVLAFNMIAKSMTKTYVISELIASALLLVLSVFLIKINGVIGLTQAYFVNYLFYMIMMIFIFRKIIFNYGNSLDEK